MDLRKVWHGALRHGRGAAPASPVGDVVYRQAGFCPICRAPVEFTATTKWYRESLVCSRCGSVPRERALALVLDRHFPKWRRLAIHESSPANRGISPAMKRACRAYVATQFFPEETPGAIIEGFRNENLEAQTFADESFDLVISLDVMEHVNHPDAAVKEIARTLKRGGAYLFTAPTHKAVLKSERRALYHPDGEVEHFAQPEYHGNPISEAGSLVTFRYGYDLPELIRVWSGMDVEVSRFHDHRHGIIGEHTEVYLASKRRP
jgi:SAM-dependent methyltransferase